MPLHTPAYTQFPNEILEAIPELSESEYKVISILVRNTLGFHRQSVQLTIQDLKRLTGLSINSVRAGVTGCIQRLWIRQSLQKPYTYSICLEQGSKSDPSTFDGSNFDPSMDQNLIRHGSNFDPSMDQNLIRHGSKSDPSMDQNLIHSSNKGFKENFKENASLSLKKPDPEGARENPLRSTEPDPTPDPVAQNPSSGLANAANGPAHRSTGAGQPVPPPPAAPGFDPFARRGMPHVIPITAQFEGPWGRGYTDDLKRFEAWLLEHKVSSRINNPSAWIAGIVDGIAKGGSRALWNEFERFEAGEVEPVVPDEEMPDWKRRWMGIA